MGVVEICLVVALGCVAVAAAWKFSTRVKRQDLGVSSINESIYKELLNKMNASLHAVAPVASRSALYADVKESLVLAASVDDLNAAAPALARLVEEFSHQAALHESRTAKSVALSDLGSRLLPQKDV